MEKKPNIIIFITDQQNADTAEGKSQAKTPNLDEFRKNAVTFTSSYTVAPHCCPSRTACLSGLYPSESGIWNNVESDSALSRTLYEGVKLFPELLKEAGYRNIFSGKWHISAYEGPLERGFDEVLSGHIAKVENENRPRANDWENEYAREKKDRIKLDEDKDFGEIVSPGYPRYYHFGLNENPSGDIDTVERACQAIDDFDSSSGSLFMYIAPTGPHDPYCPPKRFLDLYENEKIELPSSFSDDMKDKPALYRRTRDCFNLTEEEHVESLRHYLAFVSFEDELFGKVIERLKKKGIWENTYVIYMSDHGDYAGSHGLWSKGHPCFREAYRIPLLVGGGLVRQKREVDAMVSITDVAPTVLDMAGLKPYRKLSGESLLPFIEGKGDEKDWRNYHFTQTNGNEVYGIQRAVWDRKWKYVFNSFDYDELYDLENDPDEIHNLISGGIGEYKGLIKELWKAMWHFSRNSHDNFTCSYIMDRLAPFGPGIIFEDEGHDPFQGVGQNHF